ncbi:MAG: LTA synthase family protein [Myxococcota bacterium]
MERIKRILRHAVVAARAGWRPMLRRVVPRLVPSAALYVALVLVRHRLIDQLGMTYGQAFDSGLVLGWLFDFWGVVLVATAAQSVSALAPIPSRFVWPVAAFWMWLFNLGNIMHYRFFGTRLDWWVVSLHWRDVFVVSDSAAQLGSNWPVVVSTLILFGAIALVLLEPRLFPAQVSSDPTPPSFWQARRRALVQAVLLFAVVAIVHRIPPWLKIQQTTTMVSGNIVRVWVRQAFSKSLYAGAGTAWAAELAGAGTLDRSEPSRQLARYRAYGTGGQGVAEPSLQRELQPDADETRAIRRRLGLPEDGPVHVVLLFLESLRAFELYHPEIGPELYPEIRRIFAEHAIQFRQAYSSSFTAGQTVRGQFSTLCSMLPNITGAATYIAHNTLEVRCLPQYLKDYGYLTTWMNTFRSSFHGKRTFEMMHGTDLFYDGDAFRDRGVTQKFRSWGLADKPFLQETVALLEELSAGGKPVFINALTISAHHPYEEIEAGKLSEKLIAIAGTKTYYRAYLSGLRYEDIAVGAFFERLFASPVADRTLVVALGDHSSAVSPNQTLTLEQRVEMRFRIPIALVTRNLPEPAIVDHPVHQIDVAPTVARVVGLPGTVTWVGRGLLQEEGSPWLYETDGEVSYRVGNRACYAFFKKPRRCWDVTGLDPLYDAVTNEIPEDAAETEFFRNTILANFRAIVLNLVLPR